jgi:hypothetical protein
MNKICADIQKCNTIINEYLRFPAKINPSSYNCPPEITKDMKSLTHGIQYKSKLSIPINLLFFTKTNQDCMDRFHIAMTILRYMLKFPNTLTSIQVDFAFTSVPKQLPKHGLIGPSTLNTGYTSGNQIVVYREEEWLKVFIHECMHLFNYDLELRNKSELLYPLFPIQNIHINESYCEIWARILNCCVISVLNDVELDFLLQKEQKYSVYQLSNVLNYMKLTYPQLMDKRTVYTEETNAFAYLVIPAILLQDPYLFVKWCKKNNTHMLPIQSSTNYIALIQSNNTNKFIRSIPKEAFSLSTKMTTKMTINNIHL